MNIVHLLKFINQVTIWLLLKFQHEHKIKIVKYFPQIRSIAQPLSLLVTLFAMDVIPIGNKLGSDQVASVSFNIYSKIHISSMPYEKVRF